MDENNKAGLTTDPAERQHKDTDSFAVTQNEVEDMPDFGSMADGEGFNPLTDLQSDSWQRGITIGSLIVKSANQVMEDAARMPDPVDLYHGLWFEGEVCCLFADANAGKSIFAVQMADTIARDYPTFYFNGELSEKQFQLRYTDKTTGRRHVFPSKFAHAEVNPDAARSALANGEQSEDQLFADIENGAIACGAKVVIIDNLTYLCNQSEKGDAAGVVMGKLLSLKVKYGWSLLVLAHRPKVDPYSAITQNHLAGSKKLMNLFDSAFAIGQNATDDKIKYIKQVKVRHTEYLYTSDHVPTFELEKRGDFLQFSFRGYSSEKEHLKNPNMADADDLAASAKELHRQGKTIRQIADILNVSKSKVGRIVKDTGNPDAPANEDKTSTPNDDELL